jgi:Tfp pilus assembly protein PilO
MKANEQPMRQPDVPVSHDLSLRLGNQLIWQLKRLLRRLKLEGLIGLALCVLSLILLFTVLLPMQTKMADVARKIAVHPVKQKINAPVLSTEQLMANEVIKFNRQFAKVDQLPDQLDAMFRLAEGNGLLINRGEYTLVEKTQGTLRRFEVTIPISGSYLPLRAFVLDILDKMPTVSLADMTLERENIADGQVKATVRLVFFIRKNEG